jgi:hypothetical protein
MVTFKLSQQDITIGNELIYAFPTRPAMETLFLFIGTFEFRTPMIHGRFNKRKICIFEPWPQNSQAYQSQSWTLFLQKTNIIGNQIL